MKNVVQVCKLLKSQSKMPWGSSKILLSIYYFSLLQMREVRIRFISFSVCQFILLLKILTEARKFIILWISKGGLGSWHRSTVSVLLAKYWFSVYRHMLTPKYELSVGQHFGIDNTSGTKILQVLLIFALVNPQQIYPSLV